MSSFETNDNVQKIATALIGTQSTKSSRMEQTPRLQVKVSVCSENLSESAFLPFRLIVTLDNQNDHPITISKTTRVLDIPTALQKRCITFRDLETGQRVLLGNVQEDEAYRPYRTDGIPKRWRVEAKDLVLIPADGSYITEFDLKQAKGHPDGISWLSRLRPGNRYEASISEGTCIMFWSHSSIDELVSVQALLGPEWPQDHLPLDVIRDENAIFTIAG